MLGLEAYTTIPDKALQKFFFVVCVAILPSIIFWKVLLQQHTQALPVPAHTSGGESSGSEGKEEAQRGRDGTEGGFHVS